MRRRKGEGAPRATKPPAATSEAALYYKTPTTPEEAFQAIGRLRKEARDEIDRLIRFLDETDNHMEREEAVDDVACDDDELDGPENAEDEESDPPEPSLGSIGDHHFDQGRWASGGTKDLEDEHDGAEPGEDAEPALGWNQSMDQTDNGAGSMNPHESEPSLGSTSTINQEAWAFGMSQDREQGTTRNFKRKVPETALEQSNLRWPDGNVFDPSNIPPSNVIAVS
jgi:hypothetical protein